MSRELVSDELWSVVEPLLPPQKVVRTFRDGRKPKPHRDVLEAILFVLKSGLAWEDLPPQFGMSGMTCWRRLRDWNEAGVWLQLQAVLLTKLHHAGALDWSRCLIDSSSVRAVFGGPHRSQPHRSRQSGRQTSPRHRWPGHAACRRRDPGECA